MKSQLYTNIILSAIGCLLLVQILQNLGVVCTAKQDVRIVSIVQPKEEPPMSVVVRNKDFEPISIEASSWKPLFVKVTNEWWDAIPTERAFDVYLKSRRK